MLKKIFLWVRENGFWSSVAVFVVLVFGIAFAAIAISLLVLFFTSPEQIEIEGNRLIQKLFQIFLFFGIVGFLLILFPPRKRKKARYNNLCKLAEQGDAKSQYNLGVMYDNGNGISRDVSEALRWYRKAAEQGYVKAQNDLGEIYYYGSDESGELQDKREAYTWFLLVKKGGSKKADNALREYLWELTPEEIQSAKEESTRRFEEIEKRRNSETE